MKIIFSPAKDLNLSKPENKDFIINDKTEYILEELIKLSKSEIQRSLKLSDNLADKVYKYYNEFDNSLNYKAINLYNGLSYRQIDRNFKQEEIDYLDNVIILSAFYGPVKAEDIIKPYRFDMNVSIKIKGKSVKEYWRESYNKIFQENELVLNLASDEFSEIIDRDRINMIDFEFYKEKNGILTKHSTTLKKARGIMLNHLIKNRIYNIENLLNTEIKNLKYSKELSENDKLVYILK